MKRALAVANKDNGLILGDGFDEIIKRGRNVAVSGIKRFDAFNLISQKRSEIGLAVTRRPDLSARRKRR